MKQYLLTIIGATVLSAAAQILSPQTWQKYISFITGLVVIACIIAPVENLAHTKAFLFDYTEKNIIKNSISQQELVNEELSKRISNDIESRLLSEFNTVASARAVLQLDKDGKIEGVKEIHISGAPLNDRIIERLKDVYGTGKIYFD